ncbi:Glycosyl transferases group 1 [Rubripirellula obstinata]|uniref:tRNA-queuosine alpha-mannosyltransferase n=1 Tax=Rubripirellula obstinata TaxID=406547 RepID=A0A5B1CN71_9BACT|nr:DUF3524 domain-containing protein [Rubripirellula obstinata]KAA1262468.1 Glycosyl transferases group 1 [Rubripirellula obstinata]
MNSEASPRYQILAINAFDGGSHRSFLRGLIGGSDNDWTVLAGKPVHWKWRMRSSALTMADMTQQHVAKHGYPDLVFCTDMLDLPTWRGLLNDKRFADIPVINYFHESQWTYPTAPGSRVDHHFGYTNLLSAIASDACVFNSCFHRDTFLGASEQFVRKMPDSKSAHDWLALKAKSWVIPPGFDPPSFLPSRSAGEVPVIGWVSRWENDKCPQRFAELLQQLDHLSHDFRLVLLGARPADPKAASLEPLEQIRRSHGHRILYDGFAETADDYWHWLTKMDFVVSTADHEFFGIAVCEAMHAGAVPVVPDRLSYPEWVPSECLYRTTEDAIALLCLNKDERRLCSDVCRNQIAKFDRRLVASKIDNLAMRLIQAS